MLVCTSTKRFTQIKTTACTFYGDVLDGEAEDDGPDHSQGHLDVPVHDFCAIKNTNRGRISRRPRSSINPVLFCCCFFYNRTSVSLFIYDNTPTHNCTQSLQTFSFSHEVLSFINDFSSYINVLDFSI